VQPVHYVVQPVNYVVQPMNYVVQPVNYVVQPVNYVVQPVHYVVQHVHYVVQHPAHMAQPSRAVPWQGVRPFKVAAWGLPPVFPSFQRTLSIINRYNAYGMSHHVECAIRSLLDDAKI
jgi:hypothetical protein